MSNLKRVMGMLAAFVAVTMVVPAGQAREGGRGGPQMSAEEREKLATAAAPLAAKAISQYVKLSDEAAKKFTEAYVKEQEAARKRLAEVRESGNFEGMRDVFQKNAEAMQKVMADNLTEEQAKKAETVVGQFGGLDRSIQGLLRAKVDEKKMDKALPVLVKYAVAQQEVFAKMRDGSMERDQIMAKMQEARETAKKELVPIIGQEAADTWETQSGMRGMRRGGGQGGGQRGGQ